MIYLNGKPYEPNKFPDGTSLMKFYVTHKAVVICWEYQNESEMVELYSLTKHMRDRGVEDIVLRMPYIPNARMDRVKNDTEVFTLKYFAELINSLKFNKVIVRDAHSSVAMALIDNIAEEDMSKYINHAIEKSNINCLRDIVFYPDEGASKRYSEIIKFPYAFGIKKRDWDTGKILGLDVAGEVPKTYFKAMIIDDICSYGGTIYYSALKLRELGASEIYVYVTHCENSILHGKFGKEEIPLLQNGFINKVFTTKSIFTENHPLIEVIDNGL